MPPEEVMFRSGSPIWTAGAPATRRNAWRRRMRKPRQEGSSSSDPEAEASGKARGLSCKSTREAPSNPVGGQKIRCAIYTRKSSEEGLEQEFNSLDAQREACEAYVRSQKHEGWSVLPQQDRRIQEERPMDGRPAVAWLRRQGSQAYRQRDRGGDRSDDLSPLSRAGIGPGAESSARRRRRRQQAAHGGRRRRLWRQVVLARRALSDAAKPNLPRRDRPQGHGLFRRACVNHRRRTVVK